MLHRTTGQTGCPVQHHRTALGRRCGFERWLHTLPSNEEVVGRDRPTGESNPAASGMIGGEIRIVGHSYQQPTAVRRSPAYAPRMA